MSDDRIEEQVYSSEEWNNLMKEVSKADRHWSISCDEEEPIVISDFDRLPSDM